MAWGPTISFLRFVGHELEGAEDAHDRHYRELRADACAFRGAADFLQRLHDHRLVVVLASSASEGDLEAMLKIVDANGALDAMVHADDVNAAKPASWDVRAAQSAHMPCVAVESGGFSRHELEEAGALAVYQTCRPWASSSSPARSLTSSPWRRLIVEPRWPQELVLSGANHEPEESGYLREGRTLLALNA